VLRTVKVTKDEPKPPVVGLDPPTANSTYPNWTRLRVATGHNLFIVQVKAILDNGLPINRHRCVYDGETKATPTLYLALSHWARSSARMACWMSV
jgi:hypothetical protein